MIGWICAVNMLFGCNHKVLANAYKILEVIRDLILIILLYYIILHYTLYYYTHCKILQLQVKFQFENLKKTFVFTLEFSSKTPFCSSGKQITYLSFGTNFDYF